MASILIVDDEKSMREFLEILLANDGFEVSSASNGEQACSMLEKRRFDLVITDIRMDHVSGIDVLKKAKEVDSNTEVIIISAYANADTAVEAMEGGAYDFIPKPFDVDEFRIIVSEALQKKTASKVEEGEDQTGGFHFGCLIGDSPGMKAIYDLIRRVAKTNTNILISGESGTGKELVAKAIHTESQRRDRPFVVINCAGIPETLIEAELFGHRKGAFTGASMDKAGLFEAADKGTVFFDEIGELSPAIQVKLLRVIQERTFTRVGETAERSVDVRFISATNKSLEKEVIDGRFREDLFFRLNVINISIPPLRERRQDLALLAQYFLRKYSAEFGKDIKKISTFALDILSNYPFPGNVREMENIIERSVALETSNIVLPQSLTLSNFKKTKLTEDRRRNDIGPNGIKLDEVMAELEREYITKAMEMAHGSKQKAAELLGLTERSMRYRMEKLGL
jgi:two-component system, NtrC family, response regulator PilR